MIGEEFNRLKIGKFVKIISLFDKEEKTVKVIGKWNDGGLGVSCRSEDCNFTYHYPAKDVSLIGEK